LLPHGCVRIERRGLTILREGKIELEEVDFRMILDPNDPGGRAIREKHLRDLESLYNVAIRH
jgi:hypothetical protein